MKIFYDATRDLISVEGTAAVWPPRSLMAASDATGISVMLPDGVTRVLGPLSPAQVEQPLGDGTFAGFADASSAVAYLSAVFATSRSDLALTAAAPVFAGYAVMFAGAAACLHADPTSAGYVFAGIATQNAAAGSMVITQRRDAFSFSAWSWIPGEPVFALPGGVLTQAAPDTGVCHQIGAALDATTLLIAPGDIIHL